MQQFSNSAKALRTRIASIKERGILRALREDGAIDLASIMVGVLVMAIIGGVIAASVFVVIPWSQDSAAKSALDAVKTAQGIQYTMSQGGSTGIGVYVTDENLETNSNASGKPLLQDSDSVSIFVSGSTTDSAYYKAISLSATGKAYVITSTNPNTPVEYATLALANSAPTVTSMAVASGKLN
jgi:type II secretory pathway pseudopilin PulG